MIVCGVDEAGRGPLAGDVYAAAVILPETFCLPGLGDSKKLKEKERERLFDEIKLQASSFAIASASVEEIEKINILQAAMLAMRRAVEALEIKPELALIDGNRMPSGLYCRGKTLVGGDGIEPCISAASVLAKAARDRYMLKMAEEYPGYGFEKHKGYGTKEHYAALDRLGECALHRPSFLVKYYAKKKQG